MRDLGKQTQVLFFASVLIFSSVLAVWESQSAYAAQITERSLTLQAGTSDGGSKAGGVVKHFFSFKPGTSGSPVGSIKFTYCTTATGTCTMPTGLVTTAATLTAETGATGFSMVNSTNGAPYLTRTAGTIAGTPTLTYQLSNVTNPTAVNTTFFVRISTHTATNGTGGPLDSGSVTASTAEPIQLTGVMPESLIFCTGATVNTNCTSTTAGTIAFNQLFSPSDTATATSQMSASTNASGGYNVTVNGTTLTSGSNTIPGMTTSTTGTRGTSQFGMNLKLNTTATSTVAVGAEITPTSTGTDLRGQAATGYGTVDSFKFISGDTVANSANGGAGPTNSQVYTASYIVNVAGNQLAGTYTTTLTYICTPTF